MAQEESFGTFKTTKSVYDRILELKIATPQIIINYGLFLKENNYFEEAFKAYEKGIAMFKWPNVFDIWNTYLVSAFIKLFYSSSISLCQIRYSAWRHDTQHNDTRHNDA